MSRRTASTSKRWCSEIRSPRAIFPELTEAQVRAYCKENLTGYKQPRVVEFRADLPKTPVGKILRRELRDGK